MGEPCGDWGRVGGAGKPRIPRSCQSGGYLKLERSSRAPRSTACPGRRSRSSPVSPRPPWTPRAPGAARVPTSARPAPQSAFPGQLRARLPPRAQPLAARHCENGLRAPPSSSSSSPAIRDPAWGGGEAAGARPPRQPPCCSWSEARSLGPGARAGPWGVGAAPGEPPGSMQPGVGGAEVSGSGRSARPGGGGGVEGQDAVVATRCIGAPGIPRPLRASVLISWHLEVGSGRGGEWERWGVGRVGSGKGGEGCLSHRLRLLLPLAFHELPRKSRGWAQEKRGQERQRPR